jgi:hypothetical protein
MSQPSCGNLQDDMPKDGRRAVASAMVSLLDPRWLPGSLLSLIRALSMKRFLRKSQLVINAHLVSA